MLFAFAVGWVWSIASARLSVRDAASDGEIARRAAVVASALTHADAPSAAYLTDAALNALVNRMFARRVARAGNCAR